MPLPEITEQLAQMVQGLNFQQPVAYVYNPLVYAREPHVQYLQKYGSAPKEIILLGMNPGPFGMAQTGVPFGDVPMVRDWLDIDGPVGKPEREHPRRPVQGFACPRREASGKRLWGWARERYGTPAVFFARFYVINYCPLCFLDATGKNFTPDKLPVAQRRPLLDACDRALRDMVEFLQPQWVIGVGAFAEKQAQNALSGMAGVQFGRIPHPSPANPASNYGWAKNAEQAFAELGVKL